MVLIGYGVDVLPGDATTFTYYSESASTLGIQSTTHHPSTTPPYTGIVASGFFSLMWKSWPQIPHESEPQSQRQGVQ